MINIITIGLLLATCLLSVPSEAFDEYKINLIDNPDRTLELSDLGVNLTTTFNQLLSPEGIVNQFSLSIVIQIMFVVGYVISGTSGILRGHFHTQGFKCRSHPGGFEDKVYRGTNSRITSIF